VGQEDHQQPAGCAHPQLEGRQEAQALEYDSCGFFYTKFCTNQAITELKTVLGKQGKKTTC
jgi:hypothetical protein